ncbi:MAG: tetratricopeptide repeat protein [Pseudomonadota bacterium]
MLRVAKGWILCLAVFCLGCPRPQPEILIDVEPIYITYLKTGDDVRLADLNADEAFNRAEEQFRKREFSDARRLYRMVGENATSSETRRNAWHNAGLCSMSLEDYASALELFERSMGEAATNEEHAMTRALLGQCLAKLGRWSDATEAFRLALATEALPSRVRAEALVWDARGAIVRDDLKRAELRLAEAQAILLDTVRIRDQQGHELLAQSYFLRAEIFRSMALRMKMRLPQDRMERDLATRRELFRQAEDYYSIAVRVRHDHWSVRAGHGLGMMAEEFARDLQVAEVPEDLDPESRELYFKELEPFVLGILAEARDYYDRTIKLAARMKFENEWVDKCVTRRDALVARLKAPR